MEQLEEFLKEKSAAGLLRVLRPLSYRASGRIKVEDKEYLDFSSNDYLGLCGHPKLAADAKEAMDKFGTSSSGSRLLSGDLRLHHQLEEEVARFKNKEAALVFNSGYQANLGIISSLYKAGDAIFSDRLNHASIVDGILLSGARCFRFRHNDLGHLDSLLKKERSKFKQALLVAESVFSMDGDICLLKELIALKEKYNCKILVDEAHATGIFGKNGSGIVSKEGLEKEVDLIMGTFSKALGSFGAYLAASRKVIDYLVNTARSFIYSTALPPAIIAANLASIELVGSEPWRREKLEDSWRYFRAELKKAGFAAAGSTQIVPLVIGENQKTVSYAQKLQARGYWVLPIRPPTVPQGQARLRFSLSVNHTQEILQKLARDLNEIKVCLR